VPSTVPLKNLAEVKAEDESLMDLKPGTMNGRETTE